jgi:hypothetical protein
MSEPNDPITTSAELAAALEQARAQGQDKPGANKATLGLVAALLLVAGFGGGYLTKDATSGGEGPGRGNFTRMGGPGGGGPGAGGPQNLTIGTITKVDGNTVTIKTTSGATVKATIGSDTNVNVTKAGSVKDLAKGDQIVVNGQRDGDTIEAEFVSKGRGFGPRLERRGAGQGRQGDGADRSGQGG